jgi:hypothetical protein
MTEQQFDTRIKEIEAGYRSHREGADAYRDQELARLFVECGWTQERISRHMGQSQSWVARRLLFGRFLSFMTAGHKTFSPAKPLTERRFRDHWRKSKKHVKDSEEERFARVVESLRTDRSETPKNYGNLVKKPGIKAAVVEVISDGKRRTTTEIAVEVSEVVPETDAAQVGAALKQIQHKPPPGMALDARHTGQTHKYRLVKRKGPAPSPVNPERAGAVAVEAIPLVKECIEILRQPEVKRATTLALEHMWRVQQMLERLLVPEEVA